MNAHLKYETERKKLPRKKQCFFMIRTKKTYHKDTFYINSMNIFPQLNLYTKKKYMKI